MMGAFRRRVALALCPELELAAAVPAAPRRHVLPAPQHLVALAAALAAHQGVTHWAISMRVAGKGDQIDRLVRGTDVRVATYVKLLRRFSEVWPADLDWPEGVPRPDPAEDTA